MLKILLLSLVLLASHFDGASLNAKAVAVIDASNSRLLYGKNYDEILANASTTKILTCIVAIENSKMDDVVTVSDYASSMPEVKLGIKRGQRYKMEDMLYAMMLESCNDVSVAVAENIAGDTTRFSKMLNEKAKEIGCKDTYFITPNGLDMMDENGIHGTTAYDLTLIMNYCIKNKKFLEITQSKSHVFSDVDNSVKHNVNNKNSFLYTYNGMISGKTGFTSKAGYCYVGAVKINGKKMVFSILASGWPPNKDYKWKDAKKIIEYCDSNYELYDLKSYKLDLDVLQDIDILNGTKKYLDLKYSRKLKGKILKGNKEKISVKYNIKKDIEAPVEKGDILGEAVYMINGTVVDTVTLVSDEKIERINYYKCLQKVLAILSF